MVIRGESIVRNDDIQAMAGEELTDILPIGLVAAHEATAMQEYHDRSAHGPIGRLVDIEPVSRIVPVSVIACDDNTVAWLLLEQWAIDFMRQCQVEHRASGANAPRDLMRNSGVDRRH